MIYEVVRLFEELMGQSSIGLKFITLYDSYLKTINPTLKSYKYYIKVQKLLLYLYKPDF